jgi:hypothetical protein
VVDEVRRDKGKKVESLKCSILSWDGENKRPEKVLATMSFG